MTTLLYKTRRFLYLLRSTDPNDRMYLRERLHRIPVFGRIWTAGMRLRGRLLQRTEADYARMQKSSYECYAALGHVAPGVIEGDAVVGSLEQHDRWPDYKDFLMRYVPEDASWVALEYGCGPGRNIRRWTHSFKRIDGVDISERNLENARIFIKDRVSPEKWPNLYVTEGMDCGEAAPGSYDFVFSTICLQHICVHQIRFSIFENLFRCLKPGGRLSAQMGFGVPSPNTVPYYENYVQAISTNRGCDVAVSSPDQLRGDLEKIGFARFEYWLRPVGPGDIHPQWIFFTAIKPADIKEANERSASADVVHLADAHRGGP